MNKKGLLIGLLIAALAITSAACGGNNNAGNNGTTGQAPTTDGAGAGTAGGAIDEAEATALYEANCMACHAADLSGGGAFPSLTAVGSRMSQEEIAAKISEGGNGMPAFKGRLTDDEINTLAAWLATKK